MIGAEDVICSEENEAESKCAKVSSFLCRIRFHLSISLVYF